MPKKAAKPAKTVKTAKPASAPAANSTDDGLADALENVAKTPALEGKPTESKSVPKKEEIIEEVTDEDLDFSFVTKAAAAETAAEAKAAGQSVPPSAKPVAATPQAQVGQPATPVPQPPIPTSPAGAAIPGPDLDDAELADIQAAISDNIQRVEAGAAPAPGQPEAGQVAGAPAGTAPSEAVSQVIPPQPLTAEKLQPATEKMLDMLRHFRELVRELNNNLNAIASDRLKNALEKLTIDVQAEEESIKDYNASAASFLASLIENKLTPEERPFKERELRKTIATIYEEHREGTDHARQLTDLLQSLAEDESVPADQKGLLSALDLTFVVELVDKQMESFQGILADLQINLEELLKQKEAEPSAITNDLQQKIEDEMRQRAEQLLLPPVSREEFIRIASTKRERIWYHALWYIVFTVDDHTVTKKALFDALSSVTSHSAIDEVKENVFYFGLGPLLKSRLDQENVVRYRDQTFRLNVKVEKIAEVLQEIGEPISPRPQISEDTQKDLFDKFLKDDFLDI